MTRRINLALQGGGAHGAFTWGVLDRLLEEEDIEIAGISGTSAGAMNGAALKAGLHIGGREGARAELDWFWRQMGALSEPNIAEWFFPGLTAALPLAMPTAREIGRAVEYSMVGSMADMLSLVSTPYALGPLYANPLRRIVERFEFDHVCADAGPALFVSATKVRNGKIRIFEGDEVTPEALLASSCLPTLFQAVEFYDRKSERVEAYWDGGFAGNPALFPLFRQDLPDDIVIISINPLERDEVPMLPAQIQNRINEISFNSSLLRELRAIDYVKRLIDDGRVSTTEKKDVLVHLIADDGVMTDLSVATKMFPNAFLLNELKAAGRRAAETFLDRDAKNIGKQSSVNLSEMFG